MFSEQEQFAKEATEKIYGFVDSDYVIYDAVGRNVKSDLMNTAALANQVCGKGDTIFAAIINLVEKYCNCSSSDTQVLQTEEELLKSIVRMEDDFVPLAEKRRENLKKKSDRIFEDISDEDKKSIDVRQNDLKYVIAQSSIKSMYEIAACIKMYFDGLVYGLLPAGPLPDSEKSSSDGFMAKDVPIFTHEPICTDIPEDKTGPFFDGLRTLAETDSVYIKSMFRDCDNGKVYVRLFDIDNDFAPKYVEIEKVDAYYQWVISSDGYCNWPGYLIAALEANDFGIDSDPEKLFGLILGSKVNETDLSDFCTFSEDKIIIPGNTEEAKILSAYKNCGLALYASLITTNSNMIEDTEEYITLIDAVQEFTSCFALSTASKQTRDGGINLLKKHSDSFRNQANPKGSRMKKRILVCDAIDTIYELYTTRPNENPIKTIREKYPQLPL